MGFSTASTCEFQQIRISFDQDGFVAPLKYMPNMPVIAVNVLCVNSVELPYPLRKVAFCGLYHEMIMVAHLAPGMTYPVESLAYVAEYCQPIVAVIFHKVDVFTTVSPRGYVIYPPDNSIRSGLAMIGSSLNLCDCKTCPLSPSPAMRLFSYGTNL